jgi:cytochrome c oxidase cbb3-type subunit 2
MPAFADQLTDEEMAALLSCERTSWGNQAPPVKPEDVVARR